MHDIYVWPAQCPGCWYGEVGFLVLRWADIGFGNCGFGENFWVVLGRFLGFRVLSTKFLLVGILPI